jgi:hypothetical protein
VTDPDSPTSAGPTVSQPPRRGATKVKVGLYVEDSFLSRARAAYWNTAVQENNRSFSEWAARALERDVLRLEAQYNDSQQWPPLQPGDLPTGRPLES